MRTFINVITGVALTLLTTQQVSAQRYYHDRGRYSYSYGYARHYNYFAPHIRYGFYGHPYRIIPYGGFSYYYSDGYFYRPYGSYFSLIFPPVGIHINVLPYGYRTIYVGDVPYYYYNGTFYNRYDNYYEVVKAPIGAEVPELPDEARTVVINDQKYFELNGTYYKESVHENGEVWYRVAGKHGVLNTDNEPEGRSDDSEVARTPAPSTAPSATPPPTTEIGTIVSSLPENSKVVVINNQKMFEAPDGTFYSEVIENNHVSYKVVGK